MTKLEIEKCLDLRNREFFNKYISAKLDLTLISSGTSDNVWTARYKEGDKKVMVLAGMDYPNIESFTHEILHLYLFDKGFGTFGHTSIGFHKRLQQNLIDPRNTIDGITNAISHFKMLPIFTHELKMEKEKFFSVQNQLIEKENIDSLRGSFNINNSIDSRSFTNFIRYFFDLRYHMNDSLETTYTTLTQLLKSTDKVLFNILDKNCNNWESQQGYQDHVFFNSLFGELEVYLEN